MTRINDATTTITGALNDHDRETTGVCNTGRNVHPANMIARALDAAGHLMPDLPVPDTRTYPVPHWWPKHGLNYGHVYLGEGEITIARGSGGFFLTPNEAVELAHILLAAANYAERNQE